jgi:uncharacterized repeat protein (TIGR01451 family)
MHSFNAAPQFSFASQPIEKRIRAGISFLLALMMVGVAQPVTVRAAPRATGSSVPLVLAPARTRTKAPQAALGDVCFAEWDGDSVTDFSSADASAVQQAVNAASANGTVKVAGTCASVNTQGGTTQTVVITKALTLAGGFTTTNWLTSDPIANVTVLDAQNVGRVISATQPITISNLTVQHGSTTGDGAGAWFGNTANVQGVSFLQNVAGAYRSGGGAYFAGTATVSGSQFLSNTFSTVGTGGTCNTNASCGGGANFAGTASVINSTFSGNSATTGGGATLWQTAYVTSSTFAGNTATGSGGGAFISGNNTTVTATRFIANSSADGGGVALLMQTTYSNRIVNSLFARNIASNTNSGNAINVTGVTGQVNSRVDVVFSTIASPTLVAGAAINMATSGSALNITNTLIASHTIGISLTAGTATQGFNVFAGVTSPTLGTVNNTSYNLSGAPAFVNPALDNYHILSTSVANDAGMDVGINVDIDGETRPRGDAVDIGFDETDPPPAARCFATPDNGSTVFSSTTMSAIQQAVDAASTNGTVKVAGFCAGVQLRISNLQSVYISKTLTVIGGYTTTNWSSSDPVANVTIVDARGAGRSLYATADVTVSNFTIQNGNLGNSAGGGALFGSPAVVIGMTFSNNRAGQGGGAQFNTTANVTATRFVSNVVTGPGGGAYFVATAAITGTSFTRNTAASAGGALFNGTATLRNNDFISNTTTGDAGGAIFYAAGTLINTRFLSNTATFGMAGGAMLYGATTITGNAFIANSAYLGGGGLVFNSGGPNRVVNSVFARNRALNNNGSAIYNNLTLLVVQHSTIASPTLAAGNAIYNQGGLQIINSIVASHTQGIAGSANTSYNLFFGNTANGVSIGTGSVTGDPHFVDPAIDNYHIVTGSAAINAGSNISITTDFDGLSRPKGSGYDMGAFEFNNSSPVANAGLPQTVTVSSLVTLTGGLSFDPDGEPITFGWSQTSGTAVTLSNASTISPTFTAPSITGTLVFKLIVTDTLNQPSAPALITVTVVPPNVCFATPDDGTTVFSSANANAVQQAVDAASANGTVKVAGTCAGVQPRAGTTQTVVITKALTLAGGFTNTVGGWATSYPITQPTTLDALTQGRVISATQPVTLSSLSVQNGKIIGQGGGAYFGSTVILTDTQFISNTASSNGGGAYAAGAATLNDGLFRNNRSTSSGGGLYANSTLALTGTQFISNTASSNGGGAQFQGAATLNGGLFQNNTSTGDGFTDAGGGGLWANNTLSLTGTQFISNTASGYGGGARIVGATTLNGGLFQNNNSTGSFGGGGGLWANSTLALSGSLFISNTAVQGGGGAFAGGAATLNGGLFQNNSSTGSFGGGGGLYANSMPALTGTQFINNIATISGGGLYKGSGTGRIVNALFARNRAGSGMAAFFNSPGIVDVIHTTVASPTLASGSAFYVFSGTVNITNTLISSYTVGIQRAGGTVNENFTLFSGVTTPTSGTVNNGGNSITGTAGFANPAADDYQLTSASLAVDAGTNAGVTTDAFGNARPQGTGFDIGFHESSFTAASDVGIHKSATPNPGSAGGTLTYTLTFSNAGPGSAGGVVISDSVPSSITINSVSSSGATITQTSGAPNFAWQVSNLAPNAGGIITLAGTISNIVVAGDVITNTAVITAAGDGNAANNSASAMFTVTAPAACFVEIDGDNVTDFSSSDAQALRDAMLAVAPNGTVKVAGICAGAITEYGSQQVVRIAQSLTLIGGYTNTNWLAASDPIAHPTTLDALNSGRVIYVELPVTVRNLTAQNGTTSGNGAGAVFDDSASVSGVTFISNTGTFSSSRGGGASFAGTAVLTEVTFMHNSAGIGGGANFDAAAALTGTLFISNSAQFSTSSAGGAYFIAAAVVTGTQFISNNATIDAGGAFFASDAAISGGSFEHNSSGAYGGGASFNGAVSIAGTTFGGNSAGYGGGAYLYNGSHAISATVFISNSASERGGGLGLEASAGTLQSNTFIANTANAASGGGVWSDGAVQSSGDWFERNSAGTSGGGLFAEGATTLSGTTFISNTANGAGFEQGGGGAYSKGAANIVNSRFERNSTALDGGGVFAYTTLAMTGTTFLTNTATRDGGGVRGVGDARIVDSAFTANSAVKAGGGVFDNALTMANTAFISNTAGAGSSSGGIAVNGIAALTDVTFMLNSAGTGGAGGANFGSTAVLAGGAFLSNTANFAGGGAYFNGAATLNGTQFIGNRALSNRGGGAYFNGAATLNNTLFAGNVAAADRGAGAYFRVGAEVTASRFISNTASNRAGGAYFNANATLTDTDFISNTGTARAGGVYIGGNGVVNGGLIQGNVCNGSCAGGGLFISGTLTLSGTRFVSNTAADGDGGGAYTSVDATITNATFAGNQSTNTGGGLFHAGGTLTVTRSAFITNTTDGFGGGLNVANTSVAHVMSSTFSGNSAGSGGGIVVAGGATLSVHASTFAGNRASANTGEMGGGLYSFGNADIANSTFAGNHANNGGALGNGGNMTVTNSTIAANTAISAAGIANDPYWVAAATLLRNTLVASQTAGANCAFTTGTLTADGFNMADDASCASATQKTTAQIVLQALANNGGDTATMALGAGSAALEAGDDAVCAATPINNVDQRGVMRPQVLHCDVGAFELVWTNGTPLADAGTPQTVTVGTLVTLTGIASSDPDNQALTFGWSQTSGAAVTLNSNTAISPAFTAPNVAGNLIFQLVVTDAFGAVSAPAFVTVTVTHGEPTANAGALQTVYVNAAVTLNGSGSSDPESQLLTFGWSQVGGTPVALSDAMATGPTFTAPSTAGTLVFQLVVTDSSGLASAPAFVTITVEAEPVIGIPPGEVWITVTTGIARLQPTTDFSATLITGTEPITFVWDFGDGSPLVEGREASHVYAPGTYTATLTATNSAGTVTSIIHVFVPWRLLLAIIARDATLPAWVEQR